MAMPPRLIPKPPRAVAGGRGHRGGALTAAAAAEIRLGALAAAAAEIRALAPWDRRGPGGGGELHGRTEPEPGAVSRTPGRPRGRAESGGPARPCLLAGAGEPAARGPGPAWRPAAMAARPAGEGGEGSPAGACAEGGREEGRPCLTVAVAAPRGRAHLSRLGRRLGEAPGWPSSWQREKGGRGAGAPRGVGSPECGPRRRRSLEEGSRCRIRRGSREEGGEGGAVAVAEREGRGRKAGGEKRWGGEKNGEGVEKN
ncbi:translation initiation factor IF-2-like [Panicum virgatum]|uniref:translation initiation factor IF-2-like n=1 Tax=Panicum virgatum TaxID=38727 RepID=UPI0019D4FCE9|nr:translation initiation factor IF-2-like [Panicum virgatum]